LSFPSVLELQSVRLPPSRQNEPGHIPSGCPGQGMKGRNHLVPVTPGSAFS
jgi:hypothetical protein